MAVAIHRQLLLLAVVAVAGLLLPRTSAVPGAHPSLLSAEGDSDEWDDFADDSPATDPLLSPSSWVPLLDPTTSSASDYKPDSPSDALFIAGADAMISAASSGDDAAFSTACVQIEAAAATGHPSAQSVLARAGPRGAGGAAGPGPKNLGPHQRQLGQAPLILKEPPVIETVRRQGETEENKETLRKSRGEDDEDFQIRVPGPTRQCCPNVQVRASLLLWSTRTQT